MATSGSIDFVATRDDIITEALEQLGVLAEGESPNANQLASSARTLNMMMKAWQSETNLFAIQKVYVFLEKNKNEYSLSSGSDHATASYTKVQTASASASGANTIGVDSISGISDGDFIGIELDDGTMQWTTVNGSPSGSTVTLTANLTDSVSIDAYVFAYTTKANRPMEILNAVIRNTSDTDSTVSILNRQQYVELSSKKSDGEVSQIYYDPQISVGKLYVWPETSDVTDVLVLWVQRTIYDLDAASDDVDFPQEWYLALAFGLAELIGHKYGTPVSRMDRIALRAKSSREAAEGFDTEASIQFRPWSDY